MKKIKILLLAFMLPAGLLVSCNKKDKQADIQPTPEPVVQAEKFEGTWNGDQLIVEAYFMSQLLYSHEQELESGELVIKVGNNNKVEILGSDESIPGGVYNYTKVDNYTIKFNVDVEEEDGLGAGPIEYTFKVSPDNQNKANMSTEIENIVIEDGVPPMDMKLNVHLSK